MPRRPSSNSSLWFPALKWRCIGPPRGGRVVAVAGDPRDAMTFYFGGCAGGIWKTHDGGQVWRNISDGHLGSAAIGALAVAPSDPNVIYAGTGETSIRIDVSYGDGVYRSRDGGRSWQPVGLKETRHIGRICVHPQDPDLVYVAALGDAFGPNEERGVYRSRDGGASWQKVLYRNADCGAVDLSLDPLNPRIVYAACWNARRSLWHLNSGGEGSGLWRSLDGGDTWQELSGRGGLPGSAGAAGGLLGKHGVSASAAKAGRVYALVEAAAGKTGLYRSDDHGEHWTLINGHRDLMHRPWYYTHVFACPDHADTVYVNNLQMWKSSDGGASFQEITTPHGDNHALWIDPRNPARMVQGNDGGACVSFNGGQTWSSIYNQPTAQFYRIDIDNQHPYRVYGTQQDNTTISVPSASEWGAITLGDCHYPGTGESGFVAVDPRDHNIVYSGAVGSSPGGAGALQRYDHRTRQIRLVNVWPETTRGIPPRELSYRFAWTFPIVFCPRDPGTLYAAGNRVFRSRDEGQSWDCISPDLSLNDPVRQGPSGGAITHDTAGAEMHATCACLAPSPHRAGEIWASTDDGLVHVTRDDGKRWKNVTPKAMGKLAYVGCVEISAHDADTVYLSATRYKLADYRPYLFRSHDGGKSWQSINGDLPETEITRVIRADPVVAGLLFVGTETGCFFSRDDGAHWQRMKGGLPVAPVYDLKIKGSDLVLATHGRSFWILDDITPLRTLPDAARKPQLITPRATLRPALAWTAGSGFAKKGLSYGPAFGIGGNSEPTTEADGRSGRRYFDLGENPPSGAIVYYWLPPKFEGSVRLSFLDKAGRSLRNFASDDDKLGEGSRPRKTPGLHRFVWDLRQAGPTKIDAALMRRKHAPMADDSEETTGPLVRPGDMTVRLQAGDGAAIDAGFALLADPRLNVSAEALAGQSDLLELLHGKVDGLNKAVNRLRRVARQLREIESRLSAAPKPLTEGCKALQRQLADMEAVFVDPQRESSRDVLRNPGGLADALDDLIKVVAITDAAPTDSALALGQQVSERVDQQLAKFEQLLSAKLPPLNAALAAAGVATLGA